MRLLGNWLVVSFLMVVSACTSDKKGGGADAGTPDAASEAGVSPVTDAGKDAAPDVSVKDATVADTSVADATFADAADGAPTSDGGDAGRDSGAHAACQNIVIPSATFGAIYDQLLHPICSVCHQPGQFNHTLAPGEIIPPNQDFFSDRAAAFESLVGPGDAATSGVEAQGTQCGPTHEKRVAPGDAVHSLIVQKLEGSGADGKPVCGQRMPFLQVPLCESTIYKIKEWIAAGAHDD